MKNALDILLGVLLGIVLLAAVVVGFSYFTNAQNQDSSVLGQQEDNPTPNNQFPSARITQAFNSMVVSGNRQWFLLGDEFSRTDQELLLTLTLTDEQEEILSLLDLESGDLTYRIEEIDHNGDMIRDGQTNRYITYIETHQLNPGTYHASVVLRLNDQEFRSIGYEFYVSYPLYVSWTLDWEGYTVEDQYLEDIVEISEEHHNLPITHFFNPRIYVSDEVSAEEAQKLTRWVLDRRDLNGDTIGLHVHMFPDMVAAAGVEPIEDPIKWGSVLTDGYDVLTLQYSYEEMVTILNWSKQKFEDNGIGAPLMYRAGGWFAGEETLLAVQDTGFVADSSGRDRYEFGHNNVVGPWDLTATTQPYHPSLSDQNSNSGETFDIWEFPNNGGDSWAFTSAQMIDRFSQNYGSVVLDEKKVVTYLSHPEWFHVDKPKVEALFTHIDGYLYQSDQGPVVYTTLEQVQASYEINQ